ncbi:unnamed protein product [Medioppia subpectinata]|uniref:Methyltransferase domain-containing protein n=1 Tax=Medioppia subpectinata TaxID=1979941 RepID=A0A7R9L0G1_9ACAR|nr:unnamed protein product [Medioppia subpectinata]CAG2113219.1 unnamed protein product [Medioppia subpectinata]
MVVGGVLGGLAFAICGFYHHPIVTGDTKRYEGYLPYKKELDVHTGGEYELLLLDDGDKSAAHEAIKGMDLRQGGAYVSIVYTDDTGKLVGVTHNVVSPNTLQYNIIVDIGCGTGYLCELLAQSVKHKRIIEHILSIDIDPQMISYANTNHKSVQSINYWLQDMSQPWDELSPEIRALVSSVSLIVSNIAIQWFADKRRFMDVVNKLLAPKGHFVANYVLTPDIMARVSDDQHKQYDLHYEIPTMDEQINMMKLACIDAGVFVEKLYSTRNFDFFTKQGIGGPRPWPGVGNLWEMYFTSMPDLELKRYKKYGKLYGVFEGNKPILRIGDPELVKQIMVKDFHVFQTRRPDSNATHPVRDLVIPQSQGESWRRMRNTATISFSTAKLRRTATVINRSVDGFMAALRDKSLPNRVVDMKYWYATYAMDVTANCIIGATTRAYTDPNDPIVVNARNTFKPTYWHYLASMLFSNWLLNVLNIHSERNDKSINFFCQFTRELVRLKEKEEREGSSMGGEFIDFISALRRRNRVDRRLDASNSSEGT